MRSDTRLGFIVEAVPALIGYVGTDERYRFNNVAYEQWFGRPVGDVVGRHIREVLGEAVYDAIAHHVREALAGRRVTFESALTYADGKSEDHNLINGEHFADYIRRVDVPGSQFAFDLRGKQLRYLSVPVDRDQPLSKIELVKGPDRTAPIVMAVTVETR